ncbi:hypothetical protein R80B4_01851 [Fibrobacteres bacterium R8-0-B4]
MRWYVRLLKEDESRIFIAYSYEKNSLCDGVLEYNKGKHDISIEKLSEGADEFATKWLFSHIHGLLRRDGRIPEEKKCICIG